MGGSSCRQRFRRASSVRERRGSDEPSLERQWERAREGEALPQVAFDVSEHLVGRVVLHVSGELDVSAKSPFQACLSELIEANDDDILLDLADVSFIDPAVSLSCSTPVTSSTRPDASC